MRTARRVALRVLVVAISILAVGEAVANVYFARQHGHFFYTVPPTTDLNPAPELTPSPSGDSDLSFRIHPLFGYSLRPGVSVFQHLSRGGRDAHPVLAAKTQSAELPAWAATTSNNFGFFSPRDYPTRQSDDFVVGVFGGSVAQWFALQAGARLAEHLATLPELADRPVAVLNFALASYKQPQQLAVLAYSLTVGQRFDVVVNIDGFNEAALGDLNYREGVDASLPAVTVTRSFEAILLAATDDASAEYLGRLASLRAEIRRAIARGERAPMALAAVVSDAWLRRLRADYEGLAADPPNVTADSSRLWHSTPPLAGDAGKTTLADQWQHASQSMSALAASSGAAYLHVLQPNQYFGARVLTAEERRTAYLDTSPYRRAIETVYPELRVRGARLKAAGVQFLDFTDLFDGIDEAIYSDSCCHYNQRGNDMLADALFDELRELPR